MTKFVSGSFVDILHEFEQRLNFTTVLYRRFDGVWGSIDPETNKWRGMISNILMGHADMIATTLTFKAERAEAVQYLPALADETHSIVIKNPDVEDLSWTTFVIQFQKELWIVIVIVSTIVGITIWMSRELIAQKWNHVIFLDYFEM